MLRREQPVQPKAPSCKETQTNTQRDRTPNHGTLGLGRQAAPYRPISFHILFWKTVCIVGVKEQNTCGAKADYKTCKLIKMPDSLLKGHSQ
jgi:hypothetical protein